MRYVTPLRYPGGKAKLASFVKQVFEVNDLVGGQYAEVYAGGSSVALRLLLDGQVNHIHINDLSKSIYSFWFAVLYDTDNLCQLIRDTPVNMASWLQQKNVQDHKELHTSLELGFSTFFLNRTNRSGIIMSGGPIGGKEQAGDWRLDARYNKTALISRIRSIAERKEQISLYNLDAGEFTDTIARALPEKSLIFLDPPYYSKGRRLYESHYSHADHVAMASRVATLPRRWLVSYDNVPEVQRLYANFRSRVYRLNYSANAKYQGSEVVFFDNRLIIPNVQNLTGISELPRVHGMEYLLSRIERESLAVANMTMSGGALWPHVAKAGLLRSPIKMS